MEAAATSAAVVLAVVGPMRSRKGDNEEGRGGEGRENKRAHARPGTWHVGSTQHSDGALASKFANDVPRHPLPPPSPSPRPRSPPPGCTPLPPPQPPQPRAADGVTTGRLHPPPRRRRLRLAAHPVGGGERGSSARSLGWTGLAFRKLNSRTAAVRPPAARVSGGPRRRPLARSSLHRRSSSG